MLQLRTLQRLWAGLAVIFLSHAFGMPNTIAAENLGLDQTSQYLETNPATVKQPLGDSLNEQILDLSSRIMQIERQLGSIEKRLERNMMSGVILRQTKELANDAWTLAVEARAIAVRAESKADQAQKNNAR